VENQELHRALLVAALRNAARHGGRPNRKAVLGAVLASYPELRGQAELVEKELPGVIDAVSGLSTAEVESRLEELGEKPEPPRPSRKERQPAGLPELTGWEEGVVLRLAPNPNGPPSLGNARGLVVNSRYRDMYRERCADRGVPCEFIMRFDDTDPKNKPPILPAYDWYVQDADWLGCHPDRVVNASDELEMLYPVVRELIEGGHAYACDCTQRDFKEFKDAGRPCPHRDASAEDNLDAWKGMLDGGLPAGWTVRVKTQVDHPDPALRDFVALRIVEVPHPRIADRWRVWPMLDFESAVLDHHLGVTHIIRGKDLIKTEHKQRYLDDYLGWKYPHTLHWGRLRLHEYGKFSTSAMAKSIEAGEHTGWDDVRLPTLRAFRRRGFAPQAIYNSMLSLGLPETDIAFSMENLYSENRTLIDSKSMRFFFVADPVPARLEGDVPETASPPLFPKRPDAGNRTLAAGESVLLAKADADRLKAGHVVRLKDLCNLTVESVEPVVLTFESEPVRKGLPILHWCPPKPEGLQCRVVGPSEAWEGVCEPDLLRHFERAAEGEDDGEPFLVQFERFGYCRVVGVSEGGVECVWTHK